MLDPSTSDHPEELRLKILLTVFLSVFLLSACSTPKKSGADKQCGAFCQELDRCLGNDYDTDEKERLCELARCESGCRARAKAPAGYVGAFQFSKGSWKALCAPIFQKKNMPHCANIASRENLCCAATCTAAVIADGGIGHWPTCGR